MDHSFWLSDQQFARLQPLLPNKVRGGPRVDDRRVISGIIHVLQSGCRWRDAPPGYGPYKTLYNRFVRWTRKGVWDGVFAQLAAAGGAPGGATAGFDPPSRRIGRRRAEKGGGPSRPSGAPGGGRTTKVHAAVDEAGRPRRLIVRPGHRGDAPVATALVATMTPRALPGRYGLRQRCLPGVAVAPGLPARHPQQPDPQAQTSL